MPSEPRPAGVSAGVSAGVPAGVPAGPRAELAASLAASLGERTLALCRVPSVTGSETACADLVEAVLRGSPLGVERVGNTVLAAPPADARPLILLVGHLDTVPPKPADPAPHRDGDRIYGLGASDMKGGLAVMLELALTRDPSRGPRVGYVFYDQEEGPWADSGLGPALAQVPWLTTAALAFCLEPTDNVVQVGCMGTLHARVRFTGRAAHSARPWEGHNAVHDAGLLLVALGRRAPRDVRCDGHLFREVLSATLVSGGRTRNVVPDQLDVNLNFRFAPGRPATDAKEEVVAFVAEALGAARDGERLSRGDGLQAEVTFVEVAPSGRVVLDNPHLQAFLARTGAAVAAKQAWTDVARFSELGVDAVNFGPGLTGQAHQAGEWASLALLEAGFDRLRAFLDG